MKRTIAAAVAAPATAIAALALLTPLASGADDPIESDFETGSVIVYCTAPEPLSATGLAVFEAAFPALVENLQARANEGEVLRAHFLTNLREGLFVVVGGDDAEDAFDNAVALQREHVSILEDAIRVAGVGDVASAPQFCPMLQIGPVAVLPLR